MTFTSLVAAASSFVAQPFVAEQPERHFGHGFGFAPGFGLLFVLVPLFWIAVVAIIVRLSTRRWRRARFGGPGFGGPGFGGHGFGHAGWGVPQPTAAAETTLAERFAQGDIDEQEYRARLEVLRANMYPPQSPPPSASGPKMK